MILNVNGKSDGYFDDIDSGECFACNGSYYIMAYDADSDEWFGVNLANGALERFTSSSRVQKLTGEVTFKELS